MISGWWYALLERVDVGKDIGNLRSLEFWEVGRLKNSGRRCTKEERKFGLERYLKSILSGSWCISEWKFESIGDSERHLESWEFEEL